MNMHNQTIGTHTQITELESLDAPGWLDWVDALAIGVTIYGLGTVALT